MSNNIYDNTDWENDFTLYGDNRKTGYNENYDICFADDYGRKSLPIGYMELSERMDRLEAMLHDICEKRKKHKKSKKKRHNGNRKFKKRIKAVERQNTYIEAAMAQAQNADKYAWIKRTIENSVPHAIDLASNVVTNKRRLLIPTQTLNQPVCLPDKSRTR